MLNVNVTHGNKSAVIELPTQPVEKVQLILGFFVFLW